MKKTISVLLAVIMVLSTGAFVFALTLPEPDYLGHWAEQDIQEMMMEGIVDNSLPFYPDTNITRADFATYISRLLPEPPTDYAFEAGGFLDVVMGLPHSAEPPYYTTPIYYLHSLGIVQGDSEGFFHPQKEITREDIAVILYRLLELLEYQYPYATNGGLVYSFADSNEVSEYAYNAVFHLTRRSTLMKGYDRDGQDEYGDNEARFVFRPKNNLTRAEATTIIARIFSEVGKADTLPQDKELPVSFDISLLQNMPKDKNYMVSPFSLKMALAMAANGASGETKDEILKTLGIADLDLFNEAAIDFITNSNKSESVEFNIANSIWNNTSNTGNDFGFSDTFKKLIEDYYSGTASDITNENGAKTINDWIAKQTKDKIKDVITDDNVKECISFLVNTIYFKGDWAVPFAAEATKEDIFTDRNGKEQTTAFMNHTGYYSYFEDDNIQMLAKPYKDNNINMYFVLPKNSKPIQTSTFDNAILHKESKYVNLKLPKFKTEYLHENLIDISKSLGINTAFDPFKADFWNMYNKKWTGGNIFIGLILQKTFIEVDEKGTEAAATVIGMSEGSAMPPQPIDFKCDRPFTYFIRNDATGDILFMGEYAFVEQYKENSL